MVSWRTRFGEETALWISNTPFMTFFVTRTDVVFLLSTPLTFDSHVHIWFVDGSRELFL